jgi:hypothetical protein
MKRLIQKLRTELYAKPAPGEVLNAITDKKLSEIARGYPHNHDALWVGAYLADLFITEAKATGDITKHVAMALAYAQKVITEEKIPDNEAEILLELIATHHGGEQKHIESKLYKNADCFKFLDPKGVFHIFSATYDGTQKGFEEAIQYTMFKVDEKFSLVDLNAQLIAEAKTLHDRWQCIFHQMEYKKAIPRLYA